METTIIRFSGKTVLVTGVASGMGRAAARRFSDEGANVVFLDFDRAALAKASADLPQERLLIQLGGTTDKASAVAAVQAAVDRFGGLDMLINNAGTFRAGTIAETSEDDFERMLAVNVTDYFHMPKAAMPDILPSP